MTKIGVMEMRDEGVGDKNNLRLQTSGSKPQAPNSGSKPQAPNSGSKPQAPT